MTNHLPTSRQVKFMQTVVDLKRELGRDPTASDVARKLGIGRTGARKQLMALQAKGLVRDVPVEVSSGHWQTTETSRRYLKP